MAGGGTFLTVRFNVDGVVEHTENDVQSSTNVVLLDIYKPSGRYGYRFDGWYAESNFTTKIETAAEILFDIYNTDCDVYGRFVELNMNNTVKTTDIQRVMYNNEQMLEVVYNDVVVWPLDRAGYDYSGDRFKDSRYTFTQAELQTLAAKDMIYYDSVTDKLTFTATEHPIGMVFRPWDGKCVRLVALYPADPKQPDTGCVNCASGYEAKSCYAPSNSSYAYTNKICPTSSKSDGWHNMKYWYAWLNTLLDDSWKTAPTILSTYESQAAMTAWRYHTLGTQQGYWYIPASANERNYSNEDNYDSEYRYLWKILSENSSNFSKCVEFTNIHKDVLKDDFTLYNYMNRNYDHQSSYEYSNNGTAMFAFGWSHGGAYSTSQNKNGVFAQFLAMQLWPKENAKLHHELDLD